MRVVRRYSKALLRRLQKGQSFVHLTLLYKKIKKLVRQRWNKLSFYQRLTTTSLVVVFALSIFAQVIYPLLFNSKPDLTYKLSAKAEELLPLKYDLYDQKLVYKSDKQQYSFNEGYAPSTSTLGYTSGPKFSATFPRDPKQPLEILDSNNKTSIKITPKFGLRPGEKDGSRVIYAFEKNDMYRVITLGAIGYKEDIVLEAFQEDSMTLDYELILPENTEARIESDGSLGIYGVNSLLLGDVSTGTESDADLLNKARSNGEKNNRLFTLPAPFVAESNNKSSKVKAYFSLQDNVLTVNVSDLEGASYPLSIDPSVYVETARKLMRGNNETNIDFDVANELIKKGFTTGARFDTWSNTMNLNDGRWNQGTAVAGGFIYAVGGEKSASTTTTYSTAGATTYVVPAGVTEITVKLWGAGGGGGGGGTNSSGFGGAGGGSGYASATLSVTPAESLDIYVGAAGGPGDFSTGTAGNNSGDGGGGGGRSYVERGGTPLVIASGGGGGGGGDNSSATDGGAGGPGGGTSGTGGSASSSAPGGGPGTASAGGAGGNGSENDGSSGGSEFGGAGADGRTTNGADGSKNNGGAPNGGDGGNGDEANAGFGAGGGGGDGYYGGGGGSSSIASDAGGGGGGGGSSYTTGTSTTNTGGSGISPGNSADSGRAGAGDGGAGGLSSASGSAGTAGIVIISYTGTGSGPRKDVYWAQLSTTNNSIVSPNPGAGTCTNWCTDSSYDLPNERVGFSLVAYNGFLYAIGGEDVSGVRQNTVYISKLGANGEPSLWHPTDSNPDNWVYWYSSANTLTNATSFGSAVAYNNSIYFLGGQTNASTGGVTAVYRADFNPTGDIKAWSTTGMSALPSVRNMQDVKVYNDYMYVVGGDSNGTLQNSVYYTKIDSNGDLNAWTATSSFSTARSSWGGNYSVIWGGYLYLSGGCTVMNGSGYCTTVASDTQLASINSDGSLDLFGNITGVTNQRIGYGFTAWDNALYRIGGCAAQNATSGGCDSPINNEDYAVINTDGDASTVSISDASGIGNCVGSSPYDCDLPPPGDDAGEGGQMLSSVAVINGYIYVIGGCIDYDCNGTNPAGDDADATGNISYAAINSDGTLGRPDTCIDQYYGAWCVDSTNRVNGTDGIATAGVTVFNNTIYLVGGVDSTGGSGADIDGIYRNEVNFDGSLNGSWTFQNWSAVGIGASEEIFYAYVYARANPASAGTNPGNLYILGGCGNYSGTSIGCSGANYRGEVYKCNISTTGSIASCSTTGQLQIDIDPNTGGDQGIGAHAGTVYANRIYLIGGLDSVQTDRDQVIYAQFDDSNNIVAVSGSEWVESTNMLAVARRRGSGFGYNGYVYGVGGFESAGGIIDDIEFSKVDVSDGSVGPFTTSAVSINQRWGLAMGVSNSFAYVIGGCDVGNSPGSCSSFEPSVQTFQLYNNNSGTAAGYSAAGNLFGTDRYGGSAAIYNGYIYLAGGCTDANIACNSTTSDVQYASINALGEIGTWSSTSMNLPKNRAWGQLEEAGGSLYWIGGEDSGGDEKPDVYYATPETTGAAQDVFRTTTYKINSTEYSGATYTLTLNNNLEENYYVMVAGAGSNAGTQGPNQGQARVDGDPFGNLGTTTNAGEILLSRGGTTNNWVGTVTVVECLVACGTDGFQLREVVDQALAQGSANTLQTTTVTLNEDHSTNTVPFGGYLGGGLESTDTTGNDYAVTAGVRLKKTSTNQIDIERYGGEGFIPEAADITIYVVDWGSSWSIQEVNFDNWDAGGPGADATGEYTTQTITSVTRDDTWVWKSVGTSETGGLGDGALGKVLTLGDGVTENTSETTVALGSYRVSANRDDTVYILEHTNLASDYRKRAEANHGTSFTETVDAATGSETYATTGNITSVEGYRIPLFYYTDNGTGQAYPRVGGWSNYYTATGTITADKAYSGNNQAGWWQSVDFAGITYTPVAGDLANWTTATNGLPADRTQFSAASWNDRIYVVAGLDDTASETNTVYISPSLSAGGDITSAWTSDTDTPDVARSGNTVVAYANNLYSFGGYDGTNYLLDSQFTQINSDGTVDPWTFSTPLPDVIRQAEGFASNGYMYVVGGRSEDTRCDSNMWVAPISANTTIASGNNPTGVGEWYETNQRYEGNRYGSAVAYDQGRVYVLGGGCPEVGDDFDPAIDSSFWASTTGMNVGVNCGTLNSGNALASTGGASAIAQTNDFNVSSGGTVNFYAFIPTTGTGTCDDPENAEDLDLEYSTAGSGGPWTNIATYDESNYDPTQYISVAIPAGAQTSSTRFRWSINNADGTGDEWAIDSVVISTTDQFTLTGSNRVAQSSLLSQPQVARYSYYIDASSDIFPNKWLLNGLDNDIGARWQFAYRSSTDANSAWGLNTDFGDVTLGNVENYVPIDGVGANTSSARFIYVVISIDSSKAFGYPDDVTRGPTVDDFTLFFTSDPNKRLRHGKTFIQGEQQPLDTPPGP